MSKTRNSDGGRSQMGKMGNDTNPAPKRPDIGWDMRDGMVAYATDRAGQRVRKVFGSYGGTSKGLAELNVKARKWIQSVEGS